MEECRRLKKVIHHIDKKRIVASFSNFYDKIWMGFCLNTGNPFSLRLHFKSNGRSIDFSEKRSRDFQTIPLSERPACFYLTLFGNFERF